MSRAAPGHVKPLLGHSSGDVEPLGAQKPNSTGVHSSALVRLVELEWGLEEWEEELETHQTYIYIYI